MLNAALRSIVSAWQMLTRRPVPAPVPRSTPPNVGGDSRPVGGDSRRRRPAENSSTSNISGARWSPAIPQLPAACCPLPASNRRALTIVEMMVSLASVMLLMMAYVTLFSDVGGRIGDARSMIELTNRMRTASHRLRSDLESHTCDLMPWQRPEGGAGYFEIIEGPRRDYEPATSDDSATLWNEMFPLLGDFDDIVMFTVRSKEGPFTGKLNGTQVQSEVAEVVWFMRPTLKADGATAVDPLTYTLYRRVFLVLPTYQGNPVRVNLSTVGDQNGDGQTNLEDFLWLNDISVHLETVSGQNYAVANTLGDLTKRENRLWRNATGNFPFYADGVNRFYGFRAYNSTSGTAAHPRYGEDVVATNLLAFDVQIWDPTAPVYQTGSNPAVAPGDPGFSASPIGNPLTYSRPASLGAFVNLNWGNRAFNLAAPLEVQHPDGTSPDVLLSPFYSFGHSKSQLSADVLRGFPITGYATYDTWSYHYEHDGIDQNNNSKTDEGTNGFDDDAVGQPGHGVVDDPEERETSPPYPVPLRGIKIRIRCYEPDARQVHEVDVVESFVPQ